MLMLSNKTGEGMTTMPDDRESWEQKLTLSATDFDKDIHQPVSEIYFLVLEDAESGNIVGSCALYVGVGNKVPFYNYKISTISQASQSLNITLHHPILSLVNDFKGCTELGSLFLLPEYRRDGIGKFLSRSRFMLVADFPERFDSQIFAELRGYLDENNKSPFWEHFTHKFFGISYNRANLINAIDGTQFISDLMPKFPVYLDLLPHEARNVIGKPNVDTIPAMKILEKEGLEYRKYVDIFDGGPCVQCDVSQVKTVTASHDSIVKSIVADNTLEGFGYIISNALLHNYRMVLQPLKVEDGLVVINQSTAKHLQVSVGSNIRFISF